MQAIARPGSQAGVHFVRRAAVRHWQIYLNSDFARLVACEQAGAAGMAASTGHETKCRRTFMELDGAVVVPRGSLKAARPRTRASPRRAGRSVETSCAWPMRASPRNIQTMSFAKL